MAIETICSGCGQRLSVADENAGKRARCPACGQIYTIPDSTAEQGRPTADSNPWGESDAFRRKESTNAAETRAGQPPAGGQYWMRTVDGNEYGPVDEATLHRWFREGRVGPGYQIRQSEYGLWQPADIFRPSLHADTAGSASEGNNPYSPLDAGSELYRYPRPDQGVLILILGLLGFACCPIFGVAAWILGYTALNDIQAGRMDPSGRGLVQAGYYIGIASVILHVLCVGGSAILNALSLVG